MDFIKDILESIYDLVRKILESAGVDMSKFNEDLFPAE